MDISQDKPERIFIFIDESGDPGAVKSRDSSSFYQLNAVIANRSDLTFISEQFSRFRYFNNAGRELKKYSLPRYKGKICELLELCGGSSGINFAVFHITKSKYSGPYLRQGSGKYTYNPKRFKNFFVRASLECLFAEIFPKDISKYFSNGLEIEIVFDCFAISDVDEQELRAYLRNNYNLPPFLHITQIDSAYSDHVQVADYLGKLAKDLLVDKTHDCNLDFVSIYDLNQPNKPKKRKGPGHP